MPWQVNNLQIDTKAEYLSILYIDALPTLWHRGWGVEYVRWGEFVCESQKGTLGSKWEPDSMRRYDGTQTNQGKVLDNCCYMTSALQLLLFLDVSSIERENVKRKSGWKTPQPDKEDKGRKLGDYWENSSPVGRSISLKGSCCCWKTIQPNDRKIEEEN